MTPPPPPDRQIPPVEKILADRIRALRLEKGLNLAELDRLIEARPGTVAKMETGRRQVFADDLYRLACVLDVPVALLFPGPPPGPGAAHPAVAPDEAQAFAEAYQRLKSPHVRKRISDLTKAVAARRKRR